MKDIEEGKALFDTALELYNKLLSIYKAKKKRTKVQNVPENLSIDVYLDEDDLPPSHH